MVLGNVNISGCRKGDGPTGAGHANVTFRGDGMVSIVDLDTPFAGTTVGGCIAYKFRGVRVRPFAGPPVAVGKTFSLK